MLTLLSCKTYLETLLPSLGRGSCTLIVNRNPVGCALLCCWTIQKKMLRTRPLTLTLACESCFQYALMKSCSEIPFFRKQTVLDTCRVPHRVPLTGQLHPHQCSALSAAASQRINVSSARPRSRRVLPTEPRCVGGLLPAPQTGAPERDSDSNSDSDSDSDSEAGGEYTHRRGRVRTSAGLGRGKKIAAAARDPGDVTRDPPPGPGPCTRARRPEGPGRPPGVCSAE